MLQCKAVVYEKINPQKLQKITNAQFSLINLKTYTGSFLEYKIIL